MIPITSFSGRKVAVFGLGGSGLASCDALRAGGAEVTACDENLLALGGFAPTGRPPDHCIMSRGVDVLVFPLERT